MGKIIVTNRKARHNYFILESYEGGIVLEGSEVKSLREGKINFKDSFARIEKKEVFLYNMHISPYVHNTSSMLSATRTRKLLFHRRQIDKLLGQIKAKGLALVPLKLYFKKGIVKIELALAKGKKIYNKREEIKKKTAEREMAQGIKNKLISFLIGVVLLGSVPSLSYGQGKLAEEFVPLKDVCIVLKAQRCWDSITQKGMIKRGETFIKFVIDNPKVIINNSLRKLSIAPKLQEGRVMVSLEFVHKIFGEVIGRELFWDTQKKILSMKKGRNIQKIDINEVLSDYAREKEKETLFSPSWERKFAIKTIILDPGHGGRDPGAIGKNGLKEKEVTLKIAKELKKLLIKEGFKVVLTRNDDSFVSLSDRIKIANYYKGDLFISIHANAAPKSRRARTSKVGGFEIYFVSPTTNTEAIAVAARENASFNLEEEKNEYKNVILVDMVYREFVKESAELAEIVQREFDKKLNIKNRGVKQALFYVLRGVVMPSILVECAFISNWREEIKLRSSSFQEKVSKALVNSIIVYRKRFEEKKGYRE